MSLDLDQQALDLINAWETREYRHPAQKKAALQVAIRDALAQARAEGLRQAAEVCDAFAEEWKGYTIADAGEEIAARLRALAEGGE